MALMGCCCCLDLRRGTMAIGIVHVVYCALLILLSVIFLVVGPEFFIGKLLSGKVDVKTMGIILFYARIIVKAILAISVLMLLLSALLIRGAMINSSCMVLTWLIPQGILLVLSTMAIIWNLFQAIMHGGVLAIAIAAAQLGWEVIQWYWYVVVVFYRLMIKAELNLIRPLA